MSRHPLLLRRAAWLVRAAVSLVAVGCGTAFAIGTDVLVTRTFVDLALQEPVGPGGVIQAVVAVGCGLVVGVGILRVAWRTLRSIWRDWVGRWPR